MLSLCPGSLAVQQVPLRIGRTPSKMVGLCYLEAQSYDHTQAYTQQGFET